MFQDKTYQKQVYKQLPSEIQRYLQVALAKNAVIKFEAFHNAGYAGEGRSSTVKITIESDARDWEYNQDN